MSDSTITIDGVEHARADSMSSRVREWAEAIGGSVALAAMFVGGCALPGLLDSVGLLGVAGAACLVGLAGVTAWAMWTYR